MREANSKERLKNLSMFRQKENCDKKLETKLFHMFIQIFGIGCALRSEKVSDEL
jgi:hypothetical protein